MHTNVNIFLEDDVNKYFTSSVIPGFQAGTYENKGNANQLRFKNESLAKNI
jgi:hypothetical protein